MQLTINQCRKFIRSKGFRGEECEVLVHKVVLMAEIRALINEHGWSQSEAARQLKVSQPRIAEINRLCIDKFSTDLLIKYLFRLKRLVSISLIDVQKISTESIKKP